jgi:hypothetical protein
MLFYYFLGSCYIDLGSGDRDLWQDLFWQWDILGDRDLSLGLKRSPPCAATIPAFAPYQLT